VKVGAENKKQVRFMIVLLAILALIAIYNFKDYIGGTSAAAPPSATTQQKTAPGGLPVQDSSDPRLRTDILDASRKVKYEPGNRNPFALGVVIPPIDASVRTGAAAPTPTPIPTPTPWPKIPVKYYGFASKPGEPKKVFLKPEDKEQIYIVAQGEIVDRRYRLIQIQPTSVTMEDVLTGNRQPIPVEPLAQPGGR
jgi:hypothetical protein